jgi:hypothetical protein
LFWPRMTQLTGVLGVAGSIGILFKKKPHRRV